MGQARPRGADISRRPVGSFSIRNLNMIDSLLQLGREQQIPIGGMPYTVDRVGTVALGVLEDGKPSRGPRARASTARRVANRFLPGVLVIWLVWSARHAERE